VTKKDHFRPLQIAQNLKYLLIYLLHFEAKKPSADFTNFLTAFLFISFYKGKIMLFPLAFKEISLCEF